MHRSLLAGTALTALTALAAVAAAPLLGAQSASRRGIAVEPEPIVRTMPYSPYPGASVTIDPRGQPPRVPARHHRYSPYDGGTTVVYVPVPVPYDGDEYPRSGRAAYPSGSYGGAYDVNGRPLSIGFSTVPARDAVPSYTPDLSGSPYIVVENGAMLVDLPNGERRSVPSCAMQSASRDPDGRARTIFYQPSEYGLVLREGSTGRVQGSSEGSVCYGLDSFGRVTLK